MRILIFELAVSLAICSLGFSQNLKVGYMIKYEKKFYSWVKERKDKIFPQGFYLYVNKDTVSSYEFGFRTLVFDEWRNEIVFKALIFKRLYFHMYSGNAVYGGNYFYLSAGAGFYLKKDRKSNLEFFVGIPVANSFDETDRKIKHFIGLNLEVIIYETKDKR